MLFDRLIQMRGHKGIILRWPCSCEAVGIAANGSSYQGLRRRIRAQLRAIDRILLPNLWL